MVRALLEGRKTQTRRIGKCQNDSYTGLGIAYQNHKTKGRTIIATYDAFPGRGTARWAICDCPYGIPGDRLWVREAFTNLALEGYLEVFVYRADGTHSEGDGEGCELPEGVNWKPSIHMPRRACRITLEVTRVRAERIQQISEEDAAAEGAKRNDEPGEEWDGTYLTQRYIDGVEGSQNDDPEYSARDWYHRLWNSINGPGSWELNPWVWVVEFKLINL